MVGKQGYMQMFGGQKFKRYIQLQNFMHITYDLISFSCDINFDTS